MRKLLLFMAALAVFLVPVGAMAAPINFESTSILKLGDFPPANITGGGVATITTTSGHIDSLRIIPSRGAGNGNFTQLVTDPETLGNQIFAIQFIGIALETGTLTPISGGLDPDASGYDGRLPSSGLVKLCLLNSECTVTADLELTQPDPTRPGGIKGVGVGGLLTIDVLNGFANISVHAKPWQIATVVLIDQIELPTPANKITFINVTTRGFAHGPNSASSTSANVNGGVIQLISPTQVVTNLTTGTSDKVASATRLIIRFIPEPGLLLLIGAGAAGLALLGRGRFRK